MGRLRVIRTIVAGICVFAVAVALGLVIGTLAGCGDDSARCRDEVRVDESTEQGEHYRICRAGAHTVVYELDPNGQVIERPDGKVDYEPL